MSNKFETIPTTLNALIDSKKPDCVEILTNLFNDGLDKGFSNHEAYVYAEAIHFVRDHNGAASHPPLTVEETDASVKKLINDELLNRNDDGLAQARIDLVTKWYDLVRSWDIPVAISFSTAIRVGQEEWEFTHDLDEAEAVAMIEKLELHDEVKDFLFKSFYAARNSGESVLNSLRTAKEETIQFAQKRALQKMFDDLSAKGRLN